MVLDLFSNISDLLVTYSPSPFVGLIPIWEKQISFIYPGFEDMLLVSRSALNSKHFFFGFGSLAMRNQFIWKITIKPLLRSHTPIWVTFLFVSQMFLVIIHFSNKHHSLESPITLVSSTKYLQSFFVNVTIMRKSRTNIRVL